MREKQQFFYLIILSFVFMVLVNFLTFPAFRQPEVIPAAGVDLSFSQPRIEGEIFSTSLIIEPRGEKVTAVDVVLSYDPDVLTFVGFDPGSVFTNPIFLKKELDQPRGRLRIVLATQSPIETSGRLLDLKFLKADNESGSIGIKVVEEETQIAAGGESGNVLRQAETLWYQPANQLVR